MSLDSITNFFMDILTLSILQYANKNDKVDFVLSTDKDRDSFNCFIDFNNNGKMYKTNKEECAGYK